MGRTQLAPGLRFHPTDVELIKYYLKRKVLGKKLKFQGILELDIYRHSPWDLPDKSGWRSGDLKWYFFCPMEKKYASGARMNRSTDRGYWKTTGKGRRVSYNNEVVGMIKTLVFHQGKAPKGERTDWVMYEYWLQEKELTEKGIAQDAYVLCSVFKKDGPGPRNGAQYGAPFREEDWNDDDDTSSIISEALGAQSTATTNPIADNAFILPPPRPPQTVLTDEIGDMLNMFSDEGVLVPSDFHNNETTDCPVVGQNAAADPYADGINIYDDLGDLGNLIGFGEPADTMTSCSSMYPVSSMIYGDDAQFMELTDLDLPSENCAKQQEYSHAEGGGFYAGNNLVAPGDLVGAAGYGVGSQLVVTPTGYLPPQLSEGSCVPDNQGYLSSVVKR